MFEFFGVVLRTPFALFGLILVPLFAILYWAYVLVLIVLFFAASPFVFISHAFGKDKEGWENYTANFWPSIFAELSMPMDAGRAVVRWWFPSDDS